MTLCHTVQEIYAAADADSEGEEPMSQELADFVAIQLAQHLKQDAAA